MSDAEVLDRRRIFKGRVVDLAVERVRLPNGRIADLEVVRHPGAVAVVPLLGEDEVLLVRQYRHATGGWLLEIPAGKLEAGEAPERCAQREVMEETGYLPRRLVSLGWVWTTPGFTDEVIRLYLARDLEERGQELQQDEVLSVVRMPLGEALDAARDGEICDAKSVCALLRAAARLAR